MAPMGVMEISPQPWGEIGFVDPHRFDYLHDPLEIVVFLAEEPSPFGISTIGSRGMARKLPPDVFEKLRDENGRTLSQALIQMEGNPSAIHEARRSGSTVHTFLELHIEQGPVLASSGIDIGIVTGITGIHRGSVEVLGRPDHSGTTPMGCRKDALAAASEAVLALERICREIEGLVGTVGKIEVYPNATNVVPGRVRLDYEMRSFREDSIHDAMNRFATRLKEIARSRNIELRMENHPVSGRSNLTPG